MLPRAGAGFFSHAAIPPRLRRPTGRLRPTTSLERGRQPAGCPGQPVRPDPDGFRGGGRGRRFRRRRGHLGRPDRGSSPRPPGAAAPHRPRRHRRRPDRGTGRRPGTSHRPVGCRRRLPPPPAGTSGGLSGRPSGHRTGLLPGGLRRRSGNGSGLSGARPLGQRRAGARGHPAGHFPGIAPAPSLGHVPGEPRRALRRLPPGRFPRGLRTLAALARPRRGHGQTARHARHLERPAAPAFPDRSPLRARGLPPNQGRLPGSLPGRPQPLPSGRHRGRGRPDHPSPGRTPAGPRRAHHRLAGHRPAQGGQGGGRPAGSAP